MRQLSLFTAVRRCEIPRCRCSWREGERTVVVTIGAHSIDEAWPWWKPWQAQELAEAG